MLNFIKKLIPVKWLKVIRPWYHGLLAWDAHLYYERPSDRLITIGITGTSGKSTTVKMLAHLLNQNGMKCGYTTTVEFFDGQKVSINEQGLSMPSEKTLQKQLKAMVDCGCKYAIVESTSEGLAQNRHWGISFDMALFTNLASAHLESHGGYQQYKEAKARLFLGLAKSYRKTFFPKKIIGANVDDQQAQYFLSFSADKKFGVTFKNIEESSLVDPLYQARIVKPGSFELQGVMFSILIPGEFNMYNALLAAAAAHMLGVSLHDSAKAFAGFQQVSGRMEEIENNRGVRIFVDYAPEPLGMESSLNALSVMPHGRLIHVFGATGGHRDVAKRFEFGKISAKKVDIIIVTNDDVYDSDPDLIAQNIQAGVNLVAEDEKKVRQVLQILDRRMAIRRALELAKPQDIVVVTGKGSEQFLVLPGNKRVDWDERRVVREELQKMK